MTIATVRSTGTHVCLLATLGGLVLFGCKSVDLVDDVIRKVDRNEYKRKQAACGLKVTSRAFGTGRRMPIAARH